MGTNEKFVPFLGKLPEKPEFFTTKHDALVLWHYERVSTLEDNDVC